MAAECRTSLHEQLTHVLVTPFCRLLHKAFTTNTDTVSGPSDRLMLLSRLYLVQRRRSVVVAERRVGSVLQQESNHVQVTAVSRSMERRGTARSPRRRTGAALKEERAHGEVTAATRIVLEQNTRGRRETRDRRDTSQIISVLSVSLNEGHGFHFRASQSCFL